MREMAADGRESDERNSKRKGKPGKKKRRPKHPQRNGRARGEHRASLIAAIAHPVRRRILRTLVGEARSPAQMAKAFHLPPGTIAYHARVLGRVGAIELAVEKPARGAIEHFYDSTIKDDPPVETLLEETREVDEEGE